MGARVRRVETASARSKRTSRTLKIAHARLASMLTYNGANTLKVESAYLENPS